MDYEKKYNKALKRAKAAIDIATDKDLVKGVATTIFPELRESEDERIRKGLINFLRSPFIKENLTDEKVAPWLDWLEKQKEQKPILEVFGFKVGDAVRLKDGDGRKHIIKSFEEVEGVHGPNFYHVEFEDNSARDGIYPGEEYPNGYYTQMEKFEEEQKSAWSEEDEKMRNLAIEWAETMSGQFSFVDMGSTDFRKIATWLKSLRPQPKQEWNEEDENVIETLIRELRLNAQFEFAVRKLGLDYIKTLTVLDKCRRLCPCPSWKPSEEQMDSLRDTIVQTKGYSYSMYLPELYEQLKKL